MSSSSQIGPKASFNVASAVYVIHLELRMVCAQNTIRTEQLVRSESTTQCLCCGPQLQAGCCEQACHRPSELFQAPNDTKTLPQQAANSRRLHPSTSHRLPISRKRGKEREIWQGTINLIIRRRLIRLPRTFCPRLHQRGEEMERRGYEAN